MPWHVYGSDRQLYEADYHLSHLCRIKFKLPCWCNKHFYPLGHLARPISIFQ